MNHRYKVGLGVDNSILKKYPLNDSDVYKLMIENFAYDVQSEGDRSYYAVRIFEKVNNKIISTILTFNIIFSAKTLISCFVCDSRNYTREHCHDPFNAALTTFKEQCKVPKPNYVGEFPAHFCVKIMGISG